MSEKPLRGAIVPVHAREDQTVEIHWRLANGRVVSETYRAPINHDQPRRTGLEG